MRMKRIIRMRFNAFSGLKVLIIVLSVVMTCNLVRYQHFGGSYHLHYLS
jgi:hypothetical protein